LSPFRHFVIHLVYTHGFQTFEEGILGRTNTYSGRLWH
jgi:hypothetical protein